MPQDPLYNVRDAVSRELIRKGFIADCFGTNFPLLTLLREAKVMEEVFQGTGIRNPYIYDYAHGSATQPGATINPTRKQMVNDSKYDIRFYEADLEVEETEYDLYNAAGDTQIVSQEAVDNYCLAKRLEMMVEMDAYQHGQWNSGSPGGSTAGVSTDRHFSSNGFDEVFNNGVDPGPFGNYYLLTGGVTRNGVTGQAYNSTPYYCGTPSGAASSITWPVFQRAVAQLSVLGAKAKVGFTGPFGWGAVATAFRTQSVTMQLDVKEGTDFGWRSINFNGINIHEDPLCPSSMAFNFLPGGNPAAFGSTSPAKYYDGSGGSTQLSPFTHSHVQGEWRECGGRHALPDGLEHPVRYEHRPGRGAVLHRSRGDGDAASEAGLRLELQHSGECDPEQHLVEHPLSETGDQRVSRSADTRHDYLRLQGSGCSKMPQVPVSILLSWAVRGLHVSDRHDGCADGCAVPRRLTPRRRLRRSDSIGSGTVERPFRLESVSRPVSLCPHLAARNCREHRIRQAGRLRPCSVYRSGSSLGGRLRRND
jgi:hypothetical protein